MTFSACLCATFYFYIFHLLISGCASPLTFNHLLSNSRSIFVGVVVVDCSYWHHFEKGAHTSVKGSVARFDLNVPEGGRYNLSLWWPAASSLQPSWTPAVTVVGRCTTGGSPVTWATVNMQSGGDEWAFVANTELAPGCFMELSCEGEGVCIADAVLVESEARYNDGAAVTDSVVIGPRDSVVVLAHTPAPSCTKWGVTQKV